MFIAGFVTLSIRLLCIVGTRLFVVAGNGCGRTTLCTLKSGFDLTWCSLLLFFRVSLISLLVVLGSWLILLGLMRNSEKPGFPTFVALGKGRPALRNSIVRLRGGCHFYLRFTYRGVDWSGTCLLMLSIVRVLLLAVLMVGVGRSSRFSLFPGLLS